MDILTSTALSISIFTSVAFLAFSFIEEAGRRAQIRRRSGSLSAYEPAPGSGSASVDAKPWIDLPWLRIDAQASRLLRMELMRAGYFESGAPANYLAIRLALLVLLPALGVLIVPTLFGVWGIPERVLLAAVLVGVAYALPRAYLSRRRRVLEQEFELTFPNFVDLVVVCVNAGLGLEAALVRAGRELGQGDRAFGAHLELMLHETRAGKSLPDALSAFAGRLAIREAASFAGLLSQTIELGTDLSAALTTFADEMRDKRASKAEEKAAALPPKLTLPLGLFIFPVVLIAILAPAVLKVMGALGP